MKKFIMIVFVLMHRNLKNSFFSIETGMLTSLSIKVIQGCIVLFLTAQICFAVSTRNKKLNELKNILNYEEFNNTGYSSDGGIFLENKSASLRFSKEHGFVWNARVSGSDIYALSGLPAELIKLNRRGREEKIHSFETLAIAMTVNHGTLYIAELKTGKIYRLSAENKLELFAENGKYIYKLLPYNDKIIALCGDAEVYVFDKDGRVLKNIKLRGENLIAGAVYKKNLYIGASDNGYLFRVDLKTYAWDVLFQFPQKEISAVAAWNGVVYVSGNSERFVSRDIAPQRPPEPDSPHQENDEGGEEEGRFNAIGGVKEDIEKQNQIQESPRQKDLKLQTEIAGQPAQMFAAPKGQNVIYSFNLIGNKVDEITALNEPYIFDMIVSENKIYAATSSPAKIYKINTEEKNSLKVIKTFDEKHIMALKKDGDKLTAALSNPSALYEIDAVNKEKEGYFITDVFNEKNFIKIAPLDIKGSGEEVYYSYTNADGKDSSVFSAFEKKPPEDYYMSYKFKVFLKGAGKIEKINLFYLPQNREPRINNFIIDPNYKGAGLKFRLNAADPDGDKINFNLYIKKEGSEYKLVNTEEPYFTAAEYTVDTRKYEDGIYTFKLQASDKFSNPPALAIESYEEMKDVIIDNTPPQIKDVRTRGGILSFTVTDNFKPASVILKLDGGERIVFPVNKIYNSPSVSFEEKLNVDDYKFITIIAYDDAGNMSVKKVK